ncbi:MAG: nitrite/sulfite reductase [Planctomycetes bacterium]|nr:nitrite/sulfite reductase [Planctomycetota bacterium]MBU1517932.1 nitrite/sulfite reductase [Planctomycetota bacterium]MBU2458187.1 nitrite/sulfite reductase [Planctomycetota bacterium]MBU2596298.1 nitrite/sulfite reductase [Planctomycetota bacterium]
MTAEKQEKMAQKPESALRFSVAADRLHGAYPQKQTGLYMQRIKIPGGRINRLQWRTIEQIQKSFSPDTGVHLTTRQDIELHNLRLDDTVKVQRTLIDAGLSVYGGGGDNLRNITVCSGCGLCKDSFNVFDITIALDQYLQTLAALSDLPRKFKISFSGCRENCAKPYLNDIGFVAVSERHFDVIVAGSLGPVPASGIKAYEKLVAADVFALCRAAVEMFAELGERNNRRKARLRHIRQKFGDEVFLTELDKRFKQALKEPQTKIKLLTKNNPDIKLLHRLNIPDGDINAEQILLLADLCERHGVESRINLEQGIELYGTEPLELPSSLKQFEDGPIIIACQGGRTCPRGLINCQAAALKIRNVFAENKRFANVRVNISGCSNNCAHSTAAAIGFVGLKRNNKDHVQLYTGGGDGRNQNLAQKRRVESVENITSTNLPELIKA